MVRISNVLLCIILMIFIAVPALGSKHQLGKKLLQEALTKEAILILMSIS